MVDELVFVVQCRGCKKQFTIHREPFDPQKDTKAIARNLVATNPTFECDECHYRATYRAQEITCFNMKAGRGGVIGQ